MVVLDVDDARDGRDGSVTRDKLSVSQVEINSAVGRTLLEYLDSSAHGIRQQSYDCWQRGTLIK